MEENNLNINNGSSCPFCDGILIMKLNNNYCECSNCKTDFSEELEFDWS